MYWPKEGSEIYGVIQVRMVKEEVLATYTVRTFQLKHLKVSDPQHPLVNRLVLLCICLTFPVVVKVVSCSFYFFLLLLFNDMLLTPLFQLFFIFKSYLSILNPFVDLS